MDWNGLEIPNNPYYQDEWVVIYHADCRKILPQLPDKSVDLVLTDPPYKDEDVGGEYYEWWAKVYKCLQNVTKDYILFFNNSSRIYDLMQKCGKPYRILIWTKGVVKYAWRWEPIFIYSLNEPSFKINSFIHADHLPFQPINNGQHPYEKPLNLIKYLFRYIPKDKVVLDAFVGSGTTLVASKALNRRCIGIEIEEKYCEIAAKRCSQGVLDLRIYGRDSKCL